MINKLYLHRIGHRLSAAIIYGVLSAVAMNYFFRPGNIYSNGVTGISQIITELIRRSTGISMSVGIWIFIVNIPLFFLAWFKIGKQFTIFTLVAVACNSLAIILIPENTIITDPIICAIFGGALSGAGVGFAFKQGISSGGMDIISFIIKKKTQRRIGGIIMLINGVIVFIAGAFFGWPAMFYSALSIITNGRMVDFIFTNQVKAQVLIITRDPEAVSKAIIDNLHRGVTVIKGAEGGYTKSTEAVLISVVTRYELPILEKVLHSVDAKSFASVSYDCKIIGNFNEMKNEATE